MKITLKILFAFLIAIVAIGSIYAETFEKVELLDDFGDPTGVSYAHAKEDFDGTYKNTNGVSNGKLKWNIKLEDKKVTFVLKENGQANQLSTVYYTSDTFEVKVKDNEAGNTVTYNGVIAMGEEGMYNCVEVKTSYGWFTSNDLSSFLRNGNDCKIVISNSRGSYSLGALNAGEIEAMYYDVDTYNKITKAYETGSYEEVISLIEGFKNSDETSYNHFSAELKEFEKESSYHAIVKKYEQGMYEEVFEDIQAFRNEYEDHEDFETEEMYYDSARALGVYLVGDTGPAGGYIFYDVDADNESGNADRLISSECGWRYLEAAPADLRVVNGVPTVDSPVDGYSSAPAKYIFGYYRTSADGYKLYVNGTESYNEADCTSTAIGSGKSNTEKIVSAMGNSAYDEYGGTTDQYAAKLCNDLEYKGYDDWFLPSKEELDLMYKNLKRAGIGSFSDFYWPSSEYYSLATRAWYQSFSNGNQFSGNRSNEICIRPCRAF